MAGIVVDREWIGALDGRYLRRVFGELTYERAVRYTRAGRVDRIETGDHGRLLTARVHGTRAAPYQCLVVAADRRGSSRRGAGCCGAAVCGCTTGCCAPDGSGFERLILMGYS